MLDLRLKNPVPAHLAHMQLKVESRTARKFQIISLPQKDGSFVASVLEAPEILAYDRSRKIAEDKVAKKFLSTPDPFAYRHHPLAKTSAVTIEMEFDEDANAFVTFVKELRRMSSFGETESAALDNTAEMIRGYIKSSEANHKKIPLAPAKLAELKRVVRIL